jgi:predicted permease
MSEVLAEGSVSRALLKIVVVSLEANSKILVMVVLGVWATFNGVFDSKGISDMGRLVYRITLPALLFSKILKEFSLERVHVVYWLPVFCMLHVVAAYCISRLLCWALRISPFEMRVVLGALMFGNVGALAIAVVSTLCASEPLRSQIGPACESRAVSYIAWYLISQNVVMFSWGEALLFAQPVEESAMEAVVTDEDESACGLIALPADTAPVGASPSAPLLSMDGARGALPRTDADGAGVRRSRYQTSSVRLARDDGVQIRRSESFAYNQARRLSRTGACVADGFGGSELESKGAISSTLSYAEIQQAASRVSLEVMAFHPMNHQSTSLLASAATPTTALRGGGGGGAYDAKEQPLLQREANQFAVVVQRGACLHVALRIAAMRAYSVAAGVLRNPPIQAALVAVCLAAVPPVKALLVGDEAPLRFMAAAVESLGAAQVPISMLMLSGSGTINYMKTLKGKLEAQGAELLPFAFSFRTECAIIVGRLVLLPVAGYGLYWLLADGLGVLPKDDPLLLLIILIESAVPSAQNLIMMLLVHGDVVEGEAMAAVLLRQYAVSMVTFTIAAALFQSLIFGL